MRMRTGDGRTTLWSSTGMLTSPKLRTPDQSARDDRSGTALLLGVMKALAQRVGEVVGGRGGFAASGSRDRLPFAFAFEQGFEAGAMLVLVRSRVEVRLQRGDQLLGQRHLLGVHALARALVLL